MPSLADLLNTIDKSNERMTVKDETTKTKTVDSENDIRWWCPELYEESEDENDLVKNEHYPEQKRQPQMTNKKLLEFIAKGPPVF